MKQRGDDDCGWEHPDAGLLRDDDLEHRDGVYEMSRPRHACAVLSAASELRAASQPTSAKPDPLHPRSSSPDSDKETIRTLLGRLEMSIRIARVPQAAFRSDLTGGESAISVTATCYRDATQTCPATGVLQNNQFDSSVIDVTTSSGGEISRFTSEGSGRGRPIVRADRGTDPPGTIWNRIQDELRPDSHEPVRRRMPGNV